MIGQWPSGMPLLADGQTPDVAGFLKLPELTRNLIFNQVQQSGDSNLINKLESNFRSYLSELDKSEIQSAERIADARRGVSSSEMEIERLREEISKIDKKIEFYRRQQRLELLKAASTVNRLEAQAIGAQSPKKGFWAKLFS